VDRRLERQSRNEAIFREVNERVADVMDSETRMTNFLCECGNPDCVEEIPLTDAEYDEVRSQDDRFAVVPGHETATLESVVSRTERFVIVDKKPAAEPFVADDPRGAPSS
jgi:hypothetical protein